MFIVARSRRLLLWMFLATAHCGGASPPVSCPERAAAPTASASVRETPCTALGCRLLDSPDTAFHEILAQDMLVLGVGEGHAQKGTEGIPSATHRFTESVLPLLKGRASDLVIELWMPDPKCAKQVDEVKEQQKPVTASQATTNKSEFAIMAEEAKKLGIVPWPLRPTCAEYEAISRAGDDAVPQMLELTAKMAARTIKRCLERNAAAGVTKLVVAYGGAMHNDLAPPAGHEAWSFGPELSTVTGGRYVELDLFVPESILDTETWRRLAWHPYFDRRQLRKQATFFHPSAKSWVLIFPAHT